MSLYEDVLVKGILAEIIKVKDVGAISATVIMVYVAIDTMAFLSMPKNTKKNGSVEFIAWVNKYLKADESQAYQYNGKDMWGARCAKLHSYSSDSEYSKKNHCKIYAYHDGGKHLYNPETQKNLVLISTRRLVNDFSKALILFLKDVLKNPELKANVDKRLENVCNQFDIEK